MFITEEFFITVENVRCLLKITGLPENAEVPDGIEHALDNKGYSDILDSLRFYDTWITKTIKAARNISYNNDLKDISQMCGD